MVEFSDALSALKAFKRKTVYAFGKSLERLHKEVVEECEVGNRVQPYLSRQEGNLRWLSPEGVNVVIWDPAVPVDARVYRECLPVSEFVSKYVKTSKDVKKAVDGLAANSNIHLTL